MAIALTLAVIGTYFVNDTYRSYLSRRVGGIATAWQTSGSEAVNRRLSEIQSTYPSVDEVYLVKPGATGYIKYSPGGASTDVPMNLINRLNKANTAKVYGPLTSSWQDKVVTTAPVINPDNGQNAALLGISLSTRSYLFIVSLGFVVPLITGALISLAVAAADQVRLRRRESLKLRAELVSIASHELRTPLTGIRWSEESLLRSKLASSYKKTIQVMYDSTLRLQESIEDILQLANIQAGRHMELNRSSLDLVDLIKGVIATQTLPAEKNNLSIELSHNWPSELNLNCDSQRLKRVFNNLVSNAVKYAHPGTSIIIDYERSNGQHLISVTDQGIGVPAAEMDKIFTGFYRATNARSHQAGGTGMGLYLSRKTIEQHGGKLWLSSKENKGTTVFVRLPN